MLVFRSEVHPSIKRVFQESIEFYGLLRKAGLMQQGTIVGTDDQFIPTIKYLQILPPLVQILKIVLTLKTQPRGQISFRILLFGRPSIAQEPEAVLAGLIRILEILPLRLPQDSGQV
jgi:hypothetical protein